MEKKKKGINTCAGITQNKYQADNCNHRAHKSFTVRNNVCASQWPRLCLAEGALQRNTELQFGCCENQAGLLGRAIREAGASLQQREQQQGDWTTMGCTGCKHSKIIHRKLCATSKFLLTWKNKTKTLLSREKETSGRDKNENRATIMKNTVQYIWSTFDLKIKLHSIFMRKFP